MTTFAAKFELVQPGMTVTGVHRFPADTFELDELHEAAETEIWAAYLDAPVGTTLTVHEITHVEL